MRTHRFKHRDDVRVIGAGLDGTAIDKNGRAVQPRQAHQTTRHILVATPDGYQAVKALTTRHGLDGIGNDLAGNQGILHPLGAVGDAVGDGDGVENQAFPTRTIGAVGRFSGQAVDVHIAGGQVAPGRGDTDLGFAEILVGKPGGAQHGATGGFTDPVHHGAGVSAAMVLAHTGWLL